MGGTNMGSNLVKYGIFLAGILGLGVVLGQSNLQKMHRSERLGRARALDISVNYGIGDFQMHPGPSGEAFVVDLAYDKEKAHPQIDYHVSDRTGYLAVKSHSDEDDNQNHNLRDNDNHGELQFNPDVPTSMDLDFGLGKGNLEFGGAHITNLQLENGLSETSVNFSSPNKSEVDVMKFETGLGKFRAKNLGNARFHRFQFSVGLGAATLDFHEMRLPKTTAEISVGLGSATILVPKSLGVQVKADDSFLSKVSFDTDFRKHDGVYYSSNWNEANRKMIIDLSVGLGSANVEVVP